MHFALGRYSDASTALTFLKTSFPDNVELLTLNTRVLFALDRLEDAQAESQKAIILSGESGALYLLRAQILFAMVGRDSGARRMLNLASAELENDSEYMRLDGALLVREERFDEAIAVYESAIVLYPEDEDFPVRLGKLLNDVGQSDAGTTVLKDALSDGGDNIDVLKALLKSAVDREEYAEAGEYIQLILDLDDSDENLRQAVEIYLVLERYFIAASFSAMLADSADALPEDLITYGRILMSQEKADQAKEAFLKALDVAAVGDTRSIAHFELSKIAETPAERQQSLRLALGEDPQNFDALVEYSLYFEELEDYRNARQWLMQAVDLRPENEELSKRLQDINSKVGE